MEQYQKCGHKSSEKAESPGGVAETRFPGVELGPATANASARSPLVNRFISQTVKGRKNPVKSLQMWPRALKLERDFPKDATAPAPALRGDIQSFSPAARRRLKFTAANAFPELISQFGMTYHNAHPAGPTVKAHLNAFLTLLRMKFPSVRYLWILEFQKRGTAHFHLFLTLPHETPGLHKHMAKSWNQIAEPGNPLHLRFHRHASNFIPWDMGSGSYLCKYLDKEAQKAVPVGFIGVGRFWGNSRGLVPAPVTISTADIDNAYSFESVDTETGEVQEFTASEYVTRQLCRHHEKTLRHSKWKSSARSRPTSYTLPAGTSIYRQLENYLSKQRKPADAVPF